MKKSKFLNITATIFCSLALSTFIYSQPDPPNGAHGSGDNENAGGGAPIGSGVVLLLAFSAAYAGKKIFELQKNDVEE